MRTLMANVPARIRPRLFVPIPRGVPAPADATAELQLALDEHIRWRSDPAGAVADAMARKRLVREVPGGTPEVMEDMARVFLPRAQSLQPKANVHTLDGDASALRPASTPAATTAADHVNLQPTFALLETAESYYWLRPRALFTLADAVRLREGGIGRSVARKLFLSYQALQGLAALHVAGVVHGRCGGERDGSLTPRRPCRVRRACCPPPPPR